MNAVVLKKGLLRSILTIIPMLISGFASYAADNKGDLNRPSITIIRNDENSSLGRINVKNEGMDGRGKLSKIDPKFVSSSPAIIAYTAFSGFEVALDDGSTALIHNPLTSSDATSLYVTFRSNQEMPLNETEWKLYKYNENLVLNEYDSRKINYNDFELDSNTYYFASWSPNPGEDDKPLVKGLYLCKVTVKAKKSTLKSTIKFKFEVTE
ncbi:MAG: hypothetical protein QG591_1699 [Planctomycetota bacterium]|nr:hypothetical protein [Planctomycetota bacterium]